MNFIYTKNLTDPNRKKSLNHYRQKKIIILIFFLCNFFTGCSFVSVRLKDDNVNLFKITTAIHQKSLKKFKPTIKIGEWGTPVIIGWNIISTNFGNPYGGWQGKASTKKPVYGNTPESEELASALKYRGYTSVASNSDYSIEGSYSYIDINGWAVVWTSIMAVPAAVFLPVPIFGSYNYNLHITIKNSSGKMISEKEKHFTVNHTGISVFGLIKFLQSFNKKTRQAAALAAALVIDNEINKFKE